MNIQTFGIYCLLLPVTRSAVIDPEFISQYYLQKGVNQIVTFACWDKFDSVHYSLHLMSKGMRISHHNIHDKLNMKSILKVNYYKIGIVYDMDCYPSFNIFEQFSAARLPFNESYNWVAVTTETEVPPTSQIRELPLSVDSEFTLALAKRSTIVLYDIYNHSYRHGGSLNVTEMGKWSKADGLTNELSQYKYKRRQNFHGLTLNISTVLFQKPTPDLETYLTTPIHPHLDSLSRFHYALALYLGNIYNFKINLKVDKSWGYLINGSYNGILGDMVNGVCDIGAASFQYKEERMDVSDYTVETYLGRLYFYFRHPKQSAVRNPFLKPFKKNVWLTALSFSLLIWILLTISMKMESFCDSKMDCKVHSVSHSEAALITVAAICQQGSSREPYIFPGRMIFLILFLWTSMMFQFYSADIVGSLLTPPKKFINNLYDLADSNLLVAFEDLPYYPDHFRTTTDPASIYLYEKKMKQSSKEKSYTNSRYGMEQVRKGGYAFYMESSSAYKIIEDTFTQALICELSLSDISVAPSKPLSIVTSKHSPFRKMVIYGLRQIVQSGLTNRLTEIWSHRRPNCPESFRSKPVPVTLFEFSPAIIMMAGALTSVIFIVIGERMAVYLNHKKCRKCKVGVA